ncbi:MAG: hypothetical protein PVS2B2_15380 [Candidatus Acidiferrum sp.]
MGFDEHGDAAGRGVLAKFFQTGGDAGAEFIIRLLARLVPGIAAENADER